ncbi:MAG TPA: DUF1326 domain-containing protein [Candidatus Acidoferrum sp.]|jgi:hypothetical protein|nr:DUF1326 domain-containing protein [Candidatus Acidoferrum sp.]
MFKVWGISLVLALLAMSTTDTTKPDWALNATTIEACSCPMFCQCYFNAKPAAHHEQGTAAHYCKFNNAYKVNHGHYGSTNLEGAKFWITGDLGGDFSKGQMDWALVTFDKATTKEQQEALGSIIPHVFPVKWNSLQTTVGNIDTWEFNKNEAHATIDGGKTAEVKLHRFQGNTDDPVVIHNLKYWGTPRNDGFVMMPNDVETYKTGSKPFEFKGTNGFMVTIDMASTDVKQ